MDPVWCDPHKAVLTREILRNLDREQTLRNEDGRTALSWAARNGRQAVVKLLLDTGEIDADSRDKDGQTLSQAAVRGHESVVVRQYSSALNASNHVHECYAYVKADLTRELPPKYTFGCG